MTKRRPNGAGTVYRRKDGRYEGAAWVKAPGGQRSRIRVYGRTWSEANNALVKAVAGHESGAGGTAGRRTVAVYLGHWITAVAPYRVRANTLASYRQAIEAHIVPALGDKELAGLTARDVRSWLDRIAAGCRCCAQRIDARRPDGKQRCCALGSCCRMLPAPRRLQYYHGVLASALAHAVREDLLPRNVARQVQVPSGPPRRHEPLTLAEARAFLAEARGFPYGEVYELALRLGMRRGELLGLRWSDIDFDTRTLTIRRTLQRIKGEGLVEMPTKTRSSDRRIPLSPPCARALKERKRAQAAQRSRAGQAWVESGYVFTTSAGTPLSPQHVSMNVKVLCEHAGIRRVRFHDLRHSCATLLIEAGVPLITVKELLGHSSITITANAYTHTRLPYQAGALRLLDRQLDQPELRPRRPGTQAPGTRPNPGTSTSRPTAATTIRSRHP